jgi:hypothetical protein
MPVREYQVSDQEALRACVIQLQDFEREVKPPVTTKNADFAWARIRQHLETEMHRVRDEIRNYPAPIPACDAQYNYLLEEREGLSSELARVRKFMNEDSENAQNSVDAFLSVSSFLGDSAKGEIRALIESDNRHGRTTSD